VSDLAEEVKQALNETRMLMLGVQVLIGVEFEAMLAPTFDRVARTAQWSTVVTLGLLVCTVTYLYAPAMYHQITEGGYPTSGALRAATVFASVALLPFALALALSFWFVGERLWPGPVAVGIGAVTLLVTGFFWYGLEFARWWSRPARRRTTVPAGASPPKPARSSVNDRIDHVLTEVRTVLPGAQALLAFQLIAVLEEGFNRLPASSKYVHFASLASIALSTVLLLTPAAYHRIVYEGEATEDFHRFAGRVLLAATVPLALGIAGDFFVVVRKVSHQTLLSAVVSAAVLVQCYGLWFVLTVLKRRAMRRRTALEATPHAEERPRTLKVYQEANVKAKRLDKESAAPTWVLVLDKGDEVVKSIAAFARDHGLAAAHFTAIGAFSEATLGYFDRDLRDYTRIAIPEQVEVLSLVGDIALADNQPQVHAHAVVGKRDGTAHGGHVLQATVWPTLEVVLIEAPRHLRRRMDPAVGLALIDLDAA
jgi:predicted DNA-binding protein with PD1-like motif